MIDILPEIANITEIVDDRPISKLLIQSGILCAAVAFFDGIDSTSIGIATPLIAKTLKLSVADFGPIFSAALIGALLGALGLGSLGDQFGRKRMLLVATLLFGIFTLATAYATSFGGLLVVRFLAGVGLGGAIPCYIALASEYAPKAHRAMVITLIYTGFPLGAILGAFLDAFLLLHFGWHSIFLLGGAFPLIVFPFLAIWLPESLRFLLAKGKNLNEIRRIALRISPTLSRDAKIVVSEEKIGSAPIKSLFLEGRTANTLLLWFAALTAYGTASAVILWAPTLMHSHGIPLAHAAIVLGVSGVGALAGAASTGKLIEKFGVGLVLVSALGVGALAMAVIGYVGKSLLEMTLDLTVVSVFVGGIGGSGLLVLTVSTYPAAMRSTGVGWTTGLGKFGQVLMPLLTGYLVTLKWGPGKAFLVIGLMLGLGAVAALVLKERQICARDFATLS